MEISVHQVSDDIDILKAGNMRRHQNLLRNRHAIDRRAGWTSESLVWRVKTNRVACLDGQNIFMPAKVAEKSELSEQLTSTLLVCKIGYLLDRNLG